MSLTAEEVAHVARLARLYLDPDELELMRGQLNAILDYIAILQEINIEGVAATAQVTGLSTVSRPDVVNTGLTPELALINAPDQREGMFRVRAVFEE